MQLWPIWLEEELRGVLGCDYLRPLGDAQPWGLLVTVTLALAGSSLTHPSLGSSSTVLPLGGAL